ncbi:hypothetical protein ACLB2K_019093 [Fragaria x ananassa]
MKALAEKVTGILFTALSIPVEDLNWFDDPTNRTKTSGLQVFKDGVGWIPVEPEPKAIIVNLGDFTHLLSNGRFISVLHRVVVKPIQRYSVGYFYRPPMDFVVSPLLSKDLGPGEVPRYRSIIAKEYHELKAKHNEKAFSLIEN